MALFLALVQKAAMFQRRPDVNHGWRGEECVCVQDGEMQGLGHTSAWRVTCPKVEVARERVKSHG